VQTSPQNAQTKWDIQDLTGGHGRIQPALRDILTGSGAELKRYAMHVNSRNMVVRRLEIIATALGKVAIEAREQNVDTIVRFRPIWSRRLRVLNELSSLWGAQLYTEQVAPGHALVPSVALFAANALNNGSPTAADLAAAVDRALAWICRL